MKAIVWRCGGTSRSLWRKMPQVLARADGNKEGRIEGGGSGYGGRARLALRFSLTPNLISSHFHLRTARPAYHNSNGRCLKPRTLAKKAKARGQTSNPRAGPARFERSNVMRVAQPVPDASQRVVYATGMGYGEVEETSTAIKNYLLS